MQDPATRLRQAEALFHEALQQPAAARTDYLRQRCGDDELLMRNVEQLLDADAGDGDFLAAPALGPDFMMPAPEQLRTPGPQRKIGPYQLVRLLGSGGIGHVWLARRADEHFNKEVALKLIKRGMDSDAILARFRHERQILAKLEHPYIARLIDGGATDDGLPYLVMEHVDGVPIDRFCRDRGLNVNQRLELFREVCSAVQYAHQNLVVHRDIKPGNILVTSEGQPKLLDFGIARVLTPEPDTAPALTTAEHRILTPEYASPEQIQGAPITTASDVYSLGVVLYELLTDRRPYIPEPGSRTELERMICEFHPPRPSTVKYTQDSALRTQDSKFRRRLRGDLDTIVLKSLRKHPSDRYASVEQFSEDVRRHLQRLPVIARPPTWTYLGRRFAQRHAAGVGAAAVAILAVLAGLSVSIWAWSQAEAARQREAAQHQAAVDARESAQAEADKLRATHAFLLTMLTKDDPASGFPPDIELRELIDEAVESIDDGALREQPGAEAAIRTTLARVYLALGLPVKAEQQARLAYEARLVAPGRGTREYAEALAALASAVHARGRHAESEALRRESLDLHRRLYGVQSLEVVRQMHSLASVLRDQRELVEAEQLTRHALDTAIRLTGDRSLETAEARHRLAWVLLYLDLKESEQQAREALAIREAARGRNDPLVAETLLRLGRTLQAAGDYEGGKAALREAVSIAQSRLGEKHPGTLRHMNYLIILLENGREYQAAEEVCRQMLEGWRAYPGIYPDNEAAAMGSLARLRALRGDIAGAEELHREALAQMRSQLGEQHPFTVRQWLYLADLLLQQNRLGEAEALLTEAIQSQRAALGPGHEFAALNRLARVFELQGRADDCERVKRESIEMLRAARSDDDELVVQWMGQLAAVIAARGEPNRAAAVLTEHADRLRGAIQTARGTPQEPGAALALALTLRMQANTYYDAGDFARSATVAREAIAAVAPDSELRQARIAWADGHFWLGVALLGQRAYAEAEAALLQCHEGYVELHVASRWPRQTRRHLARLYEEWDAAEPGKGYAAKAAEWRDKAGEPPTTVEIDSSESPG